jgi:GrpB-like predicted nucleotidyltransferase (UPF0157 family)
MPPPIPVVLAEYDADWPHMAARLAEQLKVLGPTLVEVHHIGSTSVPGLVAKPIIDLMPLVTNLADLDNKRALVGQLGYGWHGEFGLSGRRYCTLSDELDKRIAQLHFFEAGTSQAHRHLAFRDYLRANPDVADAYAKEKQRARNLHPEDSHAYTDQKSAWIHNVEAKALIWYSERCLHLSMQQSEST